MIISLFTKCILSGFFFIKGVLWISMLLSEKIYDLSLPLNIAKKIEQNLVRKNMKSFSRIRQQKRKQRKRKGQKTKGYKTRKRVDTGWVSSAFGLQTDKKRSSFVDVIGQVSFQLVGWRLKRHKPETFHFYDRGNKGDGKMNSRRILLNSMNDLLVYFINVTIARKNSERRRKGKKD